MTPTQRSLNLTQRTHRSRGGVLHGAADRAGHRDVKPASDKAGGQLSRATLDDPAVGLRKVLDEAESMLLVHVAGVDGHCAGCADRGRFALAPCPVARWAWSVVETHGAAVWGRAAVRARGGLLAYPYECLRDATTVAGGRVVAAVHGYEPPAVVPFGGAAGRTRGRPVRRSLAEASDQDPDRLLRLHRVDHANARIRRSGRRWPAPGAPDTPQHPLHTIRSSP